MSGRQQPKLFIAGMEVFRSCTFSLHRCAGAGTSIFNIFRGDRNYESFSRTPEGNAIMGMIRFIRDDRTILFELLTIERTERGMILSVKHFTPGLVGRQEREDAIRYRLIELGNNRAVFEQEENGSLLAWEGGFDLVRPGERENGQLVWTDLFVGERIK
jgi:hypothetical protein